MFTTPAERILKDFVEFGDTGCADHEQSPPYQRTDAAEHYAKLGSHYHWNIMPSLAVALYLNRRLRSQGVHDLNAVNYCT
jgi:hypothetical protein